MPQIRNRFIQDEATALTVGSRLRKLRQTRKLTIRELADRTGVNRNTLQRLEAGRVVSTKILIKVCEALHTVPTNLVVSDEEWEQPYRVHQREDDAWHFGHNKKSAPPLYRSFTPAPDLVERARLGSVGFVSSYINPHRSALREGQFQAAVIELYDVHDEAAHHGGEEFVYCLRGRVRVTIGEKEVILCEGESVTFWSHHPHVYGPATRPAPGEPAPQLLMVWIEGPEPESLRQSESG